MRRDDAERSDGKRVSLADVIVLGGCAAVEAAAKKLSKLANSLDETAPRAAQLAREWAGIFGQKWKFRVVVRYEWVIKFKQSANQFG